MFGKSKKIADKIKAGDEFLRENKLVEAEASYREALLLDVQNAETLYSLGCIAIRRSDSASTEAWARKAISADPSHRNAHFLLANAQFASERFEEALETLLSVNTAEDDDQPRSLVGFIHEKLGHWQEAEEAFRSVLERRSASYNSRYAVVAMHDHNPFLADVQHGLARVLQRQGNREEAWLHYHLCKRMDPTMPLDPMFREIIRDEDLENHPYFDKREAVEPTENSEFTAKISYALEQKNLSQLVEVARKFRFSENLQELGNMIQASQHFGKFAASARIRLIGDVANGDDAQPLFSVLESQSTFRVLELAELHHSGELDEKHTLQLAGRIEVESSIRAALVALVRRYVRLEPETGRFVALVLRSSLKTSNEPEPRAYADYIWGECLYALQKYREAESALESSCLSFEKAGPSGYAVNAFQMLVRMQSDRNKPKLAVQSAGRLVALAAKGSDSNDLIHALSLLSQVQAVTGNLKESHATASRAAELIKKHGASPQLQEGIRRHLERTAALTGLPAPNLPAVVLESEESEKDLFRLISNAEELSEEGKQEEACALLERARALSLAQNRFQETVRVLFLLGQIQHESGKLDEAGETLREALNRAEPISTIVDPWPILVELARLAETLGDRKLAIEHLERALAEARRRADHEQQAYCHKVLSSLLLDSDETRALEHMGEFLRINPGSSESEPELLQQALSAFEEKRYQEAVDSFTTYLDQTRPDDDSRPSATTNLGLSYYALGKTAEAASHLSRAAEGFLEQGNSERAIEVLRRLIVIQVEAAQNIDPYFAQVVEVAKSCVGKGLRRSCLTNAAKIAADVDKYSDAEQMALEALEIATSKEWRDLGSEIECRMTLGRVFRVTGRFKEAVEHYDKALAGVQYMKDEPLEGTIRGWKAVAHRYLNQLDLAREEYRQAIEIALKYHEAVDEAVHRFNLGPVLLDLGLEEEALETTLIALQLADRSEQKRLATRVLVTLATSWTRDKLPEEVRERLQSLEKEWLQSRDTVVRSLALTNKAQRLLNNGEIEEGIRVFDEIIALQKQVGDGYNHAATYLNRARSLAAVDWHKALQDITEARRLAELLSHRALVLDCDEFLLTLAIQWEDLALVEEALQEILPAWLNLRNSLAGDADRIRFADKVSAAAERCAEFFLKEGRINQAFDILEWSRAQALSDLIALRAANPPPTEDLEPSDTDEEETPLKPKPAATIVAPSMPATSEDASRIISILERPTAIISLSYLGEELKGMALRSGSEVLQTFDTEFTRSEINHWLEDFRFEMYENRGLGALTWLDPGAKLMASMADYIQPNDLVIFILEEELQSLPLTALSLPDGELLVSRAAVTYLPSITVLRQLADRKRVPAGSKLLDVVSIGIAFPDEALAIQHIVGGTALTGNALAKKDIAAMLKGKNIVHFSCHGHFDPELPLQSGLHLRTPSSPFINDILTVSDLTRWRIDSSLVTLSACETGRGDIAVSEFIGLTRSLLAAGANSVLATLWPVRNEPTLNFMLAFYEELEEASKQSSRVDTAETLRTTQQQFSSKTNLYDWAAFKLIGWPTFSVG